MTLLHPFNQLDHRRVAGKTVADLTRLWIACRKKAHTSLDLSGRRGIALGIPCLEGRTRRRKGYSIETFWCLLGRTATGILCRTRRPGTRKKNGWHRSP